MQCVDVRVIYSVKQIWLGTILFYLFPCTIYLEIEKDSTAQLGAREVWVHEIGMKLIAYYCVEILYSSAHNLFSVKKN